MERAVKQLLFPVNIDQPPGLPIWQRIHCYASLDVCLHLETLSLFTPDLLVVIQLYAARLDTCFDLHNLCFKFGGCGQSRQARGIRQGSDRGRTRRDDAWDRFGPGRS